MIEQHSLDWYRSRIGRITGSQVGRLMKKGRKDEFGEDAKTYIYQLAAERTMSPDILMDNIEFEKYLDQVNVETKAMRFGTEMESVARDTYCLLKDVQCEEVGLCDHFSIEGFSSSPDGLIHTPEGLVALEIKCPVQSTFMRYKTEIYNNESLLNVKPEYFYQCMAHMMCTNAIRTDFIVFNPFQEESIHVVSILPDENVFKEMEKRIEGANTLINHITNKFISSNG